MGAAVVPASSAVVDPSTLNAPGTYWFAAGTHYLSGKILPASGNVYEGATGAILDGSHAGYSGAFGGPNPNVTIEYLTIENYSLGAGTASVNSAALNDSLEANWTIEHDTIRGIGQLSTLNSNGTMKAARGGYAVDLTTNGTLSYSCMTGDAQGGFNAYPQGTALATNVTITHNEMSHAESDGGALENYCGCSAGGGKFFFLENSTISDNYVHDNPGVPGIWGDTNNTGDVIEGNYVADNGDTGIIYEASYNALIEDNTLVDNGWTHAADNIANGGGDFPVAGGIYLADSGGDAQVPGGSQNISTITISGNVFTNNWGGVVVWNDSNRFCGPAGNTQTCTLAPLASEAACQKPGFIFTPNPSNPATYSPSYSAAAGLYWDCRYNAENVKVTDNTFTLVPAEIPGCQASTPQNTMWSGDPGFVRGVDGGECGFNSTVAEYAAGSTCAPVSSSCTGDPYVGTDIEDAVAFHENNVFSDNTYIGPWSFQAPEVGDSMLTFAQWQAAPYNQDAGSTLRNS